MIDILRDIVKHTHGLGFLDLVKIAGTSDETTIDSMAEDRSVILQGSFHKPQSEMVGTFGMPQLNKLDIHLKCPEYKDKAKISVLTGERNGASVPTGIHFENEKGDFKNDYRFMNAEIINEKLKTVKFKGVKWDVEIEPSVASVQRFNFQSIANTEHNSFVVRTEDGNLIFSFGDAASHGGEFVFANGVDGTLNKGWSWPVGQVLQILKLSDSAKVTLHFSNEGAMMVSVDSGLGKYQYIIPAQAQ
ncbi:MAG: hypothetical protein CBD92_000910 [Pelagibacteraceae bacterium TMED232]|nr:MAG: hypothetical protein CBD92_000910 [Pelagibacteraceae bacterium TMED232]|tara:strand:+ start:4809 stop:5546 length:738 start_codon:yes stop_codon:yes gene_type:complete